MNSKNKIMCFLIFLIFLNSAFASPANEKFWGSSEKEIGSGLLLAKRLYNIPSKMKILFPKKKIKVFTIDLNSDEKLDYIVYEIKKFRTCYVDSEYHLRSCEKRGEGDGFSYYYFVKLDSEPMLKLFDFSGDEDYSDYSLYSLNTKTWKPELLFKINPFIKATDREHKGIYWGYPWDITGITLKKKNGKIQFFGMNEKSEDEDSGEISNAVQILFNGIPTQGGEKGEYTNLEKKFKLTTLKEMVHQTKLKH